VSGNRFSQFRRSSSYLGLTRLADMIWPPRSLLSDARLASQGTIEADLWQALDFLFGPVCVRCGVPLPDATTPEVVCPACLAQPPVWRQARAALVYDDLSRPLVLAMKHGARKDGVSVFANWMVEAAPYAFEADLIMPVPLHWTRLWSRGYNQAGWLAQSIAQRVAGVYAPELLIRKRRTPTQHGKSASGRARNVAGAFEVPPAKAPDLEGRHVLLVDDVFTTGATIEACTKVLLRAGAGKVDAVALARVVRPSQVDIPDEPDLARQEDGLDP
jgi:ComF family protein